MPSELRPSTTPWLLALGAALGLATAIGGILEPGPASEALLPGDAAAVVNGETIDRAQFERAVGLLAADSKNEITDADRRHVLDRLIEEELLVQRARELMVDRHDRRVRSLLVRSMIDSVLADSEASEPDPADLAAFYDQHRDYFAPTGRIQVEAHRFGQRPAQPGDDPRARATEAVRRLRGGKAAALVDAELADPQIAPVPRSLLPPSKLRQYLGPTPTKISLTIETGSISDPIESGGSWWVVRVVDRQAGETPALEGISDEVKGEMRRRKGEEGLRAYLAELRSRGDVQIATDAS